MHYLPSEHSLPTWQWDEKLQAYLLRIGLGTGWTKQNTCFVVKSHSPHNFETTGKYKSNYVNYHLSIIKEN
jgi:hypothetical protein